MGARNLRIQKAHRVKLAVGSDEYHNTPVPEVMYLHGLGVFRASSPAVRHFEFIPA